MSNHLDPQYLNVVDKVLTYGIEKPTRTGTPALTIAGATIEHDMSEGFPAITSKKVALNVMKTETEGFLKGVTDKRWFQERNCHIWDDWCNPQVVPHARDPETRARMLAENNMGPIYGFQWRYFGAEYKGPHADYTGQGTDQLKRALDLLRKDPMTRKAVVSAWNPLDLEQMAIEPCHVLFRPWILGNKLNLTWYQRSVDTMLGLPFNIASYATLLHLFARELGLKEGTLLGLLDDVHIYTPHVENAKVQLARKPFELPQIETVGGLLDWEASKTRFVNYESHPKLYFERFI